MSEDLDYLTLYLPFHGATERGPHSHLIADKVIEWLNEHVGPGTMSGHDWLLGALERKFEWHYGGVYHSPDSHHTACARKFMFRDNKKALLFKLTWGG